jgi:hypothetical protein
MSQENAVPTRKRWSANPTPAELQEQAASARNIVAAARLVSQGIRDHFPIEGQDWSWKDFLAPRALVLQVTRAFFVLAKRLEPPRYEEAIEAIPRISVTSAVGITGPDLPPDAHIAALRIIQLHDDLLRHDDWTNRVLCYKTDEA